MRQELMLQEPGAREGAHLTKARPWRSHVCCRSPERGTPWVDESPSSSVPTAPLSDKSQQRVSWHVEPSPPSQSRHCSVDLYLRGNKFIVGAPVLICTHCHTSQRAFGIAYSQLTGFPKLNFHKRFLTGFAAFSLHF